MHRRCRPSTHVCEHRLARLVGAVEQQAAHVRDALVHQLDAERQDAKLGHSGADLRARAFQ